MDAAANGTVRTCFNLPIQVNSKSLWASKGDPCQVLSNPMPTLDVQIALIYSGTLLFHTFLGRIGMPRLTSMTLIGFFFGTILNRTRGKILFSFNSQERLGVVCVFGYLMFLFYIGVKTDMSMLHRTGRNAVNIGVVAILAPFLCGVVVHRFFSSKYLDPEQKETLQFVTGMLSLTPFPVISSLLSDLKILNSELGRLGLSSALVTEMFSIFLTTLFTTANIYQHYGPYRAVMDMGAVILFIFVLIFILRPLMFWIISQTPEGCPVSDHYVYGILALALLLSFGSYRFDFHALLWPYLLGLAVPVGPPLGTAITKKIDTFVNGVFKPLFVTTCAMRVDLLDFMNWSDPENGKLDLLMVQTSLLVFIVYAAKFGACMLPPLYTKMSLKDSVTLSLIMGCKGIVEMATYAFYRDTTGMPGNVFTLLMIGVLVNATATPMFLAALYDPSKKYAGYTKRNIMDLKRNTELRVLTCIHRADNILPTINLLEATYPRKEEPVAVYVLQLIELIGRASPVFINHQLQRKTSKERRIAQHLLDAFDSIEQEFRGTLTVNTFTAVSPAEVMHDDICTLALDNLVSLIVMPYHQKWSSDGRSIELADKSLRELNFSVLERAPCSVGILIERSLMTHTFSPEAPYSVCLLFIGGKDDREAFFFAKRMTMNPHVRLTVVRFMASTNNNNVEIQEWAAVLETKMLTELKMKKKIGDAHVRYKEKNVKDGPETALIVRSMVSEYDLMIVGRREGEESPETSGLLQWCEYPELGVLGDLLASTDVSGKASVLIVQQQKTASDF